MDPHMTTFELATLVLPLAASALGGAIIYYIRAVDKKLSDQDSRHSEIGKKLDRLDTMMSHELRLMDVRLTRLEGAVGMK
jgi:hypothetical protein